MRVALVLHHPQGGGWAKLILHTSRTHPESHWCCMAAVANCLRCPQSFAARPATPQKKGRKEGKWASCQARGGYQMVSGSREGGRERERRGGGGEGMRKSIHCRHAKRVVGNQVVESCTWDTPEIYSIQFIPPLDLPRVRPRF